MIAMIAVGFVIIPMIVSWEWKFAKYSVVPARFIRNPSAVLAAAIGFLDFVSIFLFP